MTFRERAAKVIAQECCTYSKRYDQFIEGVSPTHFKYIKNAIAMYGENNKSYMDFAGALGSVSYIAGMNNASIPFVDEIVLAEMLQKRIPCLERMKFLKTGSEACLAACRIARAHTGKSIIIGSGYHGWGDMFISAESPGAGCIDGMYIKLNSLDSVLSFMKKLTSNHDNFAAVIIEPVELDINVKEKIEEIAFLCKKNNILLIFDEIITGFRFLDYCVANHFGIQPDIICLGKTLGNGHPLSVVGGKQEIMNNPNYFVSSTFAGEYNTIQKSTQYLLSISRKDIRWLWGIGKRFIKDFNIIDKDIQLVGYPTRAIWKGDDKKIWLFWQEMLKGPCAYLLGKSFFIKYDMCNYLPGFLKVAKKTIERINKGNVKFEGKEPKPVFKRT